MNKLTKLFFSAAILTFCSVSLIGQKKYTKDADHAFDHEQYFSAIELYKKAETRAKRPSDKGRINFKIGDCYRLLLEPRQAETYFKRSLKLKYDKENPEVYLHLADVLRVSSEYKSAQDYYKKYLAVKPKNQHALTGEKACKAAQKWMASPSRHRINNEASLNSDRYDMCASWSDKKYKSFVFSSTREGGNGSKVDPRTGESYFDLWETTRDNNGKWGEPVPLATTINTPDNEGAAVFNAKRTEMFFTRCPTEKKKNLGCTIMHSLRQGKGWKPAKEIGLRPEGADSLSVGHPTLDRSGKVMVFAGDIPGTIGGKDLWVTKFDKKTKKWSRPVNLGPKINTPGDEVFPFLRDNGTLYFSSNGHLGMGGLDIFKAVSSGNNEWTDVENLGYPLNSSSDDHSIIFDRGENERGFFTSNRTGVKGKDDIYSFMLPAITFELECIVKNKETGEVIPGAKIVLTGSDGTVVEKNTDAGGKFLFADNGAKRFINKETNYSVGISKEDFLIGNGQISTVGIETSKKFVQEFFIQPASKDVVIAFPEVRYAFNKAELQIIEGEINSQDSLDFLLATLIENSTIVIELQAHTDCRGGDQYNRELSQRRAQSCVDYLISKGVPAERMVAQGYGEDAPRAGLECEKINTLKTEEEQEAAHQKNRRTQFKVLSFDFKGTNKLGIVAGKEAEAEQFLKDWRKKH